jgi:hypothetical protein
MKTNKAQSASADLQTKQSTTNNMNQNKKNDSRVTKQFTIGLLSILLLIGSGALLDKPSSRDARPVGSSLKPLPPASAQNLKAAPRIRGDDSLLDAGAVTSHNWSGYAATAPTPTADTVTTVTGTWTVPTVTGTESSLSAVWVGMDGFLDNGDQDTNSVEQLGTMQALTIISVTRGHKTTVSTVSSYFAWVEMWPAPTVVLSQTTYPVEPGDTITASVTYSESEGAFVRAMTSSRGWTYMDVVSWAVPERMTAEWVVEAPSTSGMVDPLADFGTVTFTDCSATINGITGPISDFNWDAITMLTTSGAAVRAVPSGLSGDGSGFSVTWKHN